MTQMEEENTKPNMRQPIPIADDKILI